MDEEVKKPGERSEEGLNSLRDHNADPKPAELKPSKDADSSSKDVQQEKGVQLQSQTSNLKSQTTNMETHAHHLHKAPGHGWKHYLFEFLMLFLAVFCGFLAENLREKVVEHKQEKQYVSSFIEDLKSDTSFIDRYIGSKIEKKKMNDSLIWYLNTPDPNKYGQRIYFIARQLTRTFNFFPADRTIKQLKNSGGLRLITQRASDSIMAYDQAIDRILLTQSRQESEVTEIRPMMGRLMDPNVLETMIEGEAIHAPAGNPPLRTVDRQFLLDFIYALHQLKTSDAVNVARLQTLKERATGIMRFLQDEYGFSK